MWHREELIYLGQKIACWAPSSIATKGKTAGGPMGKNCFNSALCPILFGLAPLWTECYELQINFVHFSCTRRDTREKLKVTSDRTLSLSFQGKEVQSREFSHCGRKPSAIQMLLFRERENENAKVGMMWISYISRTTIFGELNLLLPLFTFKKHIKEQKTLKYQKSDVLTHPEDIAVQILLCILDSSHETC